MRRGFAVELVEGRPDSLVELAEWLGTSGYMPYRRCVTDADGAAVRASVRLVEVTTEGDATRFAALIRRTPNDHHAVAAIVMERDDISLAKALAVGPDDLLTYPFAAEELANRLAALHQLGRARAVIAERGRTLSSFDPPAMAPRQTPARPAAVQRPRILIIGPASQHKVKIREAMGSALITYADNLEQAEGALSAGDLHLVVLLGTSPAARRDLLRWPELSSPNVSATLLVLDAVSKDDHREMQQRMALLPVTDRLTLPQPAELVRARTDFWLTFVDLQRQLRSPPSGLLVGLCHDGLTNLFNHAYFLEHLKTLDLTPSHRRAMIVLEVINLARLNEATSHAMTNRYLAALGPAFRRLLRAEDLVAHLGAGRFAALLDDVAPGAVPQIARRLEKALARVAFAGPLAPRLTARSFELGADAAPMQLLGQALHWHAQPRAAA